MMKTYEHFKIAVDEHQIFWLTFDKKDASVNSINVDVMQELDHILKAVHEDEARYTGLILVSGKKTGFAAGADITQFHQLVDAASAADFLKEGQRVFGKIESLTIPTVALITGFCLGGGLELALACRYRIAEESPKTKLGLPEVKLGIHPGWGGSVRLPRLIGALPALNLMLTGRILNDRAALKFGIVDLLVPQRQLHHAGVAYIQKQPKPHRASMLAACIAWPPVRPLVGAYLKKVLHKNHVTKAHYPAPFQIIHNWEKQSVYQQKAYTLEATTCGQLFLTETAKNLIRVFFLQEALKNLATTKTPAITHVHVIGAGTMGGDIAAWSAFRGLRVTLQDVSQAMIAKAMKKAYGFFKEKLKAPNLIMQAMDRFIPDPKGEGVLQADLIIEAVVEDLAVKQAVFKAVEAKAKPTAILATNTSSILLHEISQGLADKTRFVGIHFFNPVAKMQLVEIVRGHETSDETLNRAISFARKIDRLPLPVKSSPGFLVNRILMPYLLESVAMLNEGLSKETIDAAMVEFGMPMGPLNLVDVVGLDVCLSVATYLKQHLPMTIPEALTMRVKQKQLGCKTGEGFYRYTKTGKRIKNNKSIDRTAFSMITARLTNAMLKEAMLLLNKGIVENADFLDAGMIFGTGFAPFRGGLMHWHASQAAHADAPTQNH